MLDTVKNTLARQRQTIWQDAIGAVSLVVMLLVALHLPAFL